jgi:hypothetical protein
MAADMVGLPASQVAVVPGTMHITLFHRTDWLQSMVAEFLDAPLPEAQ